MDFDIERFDISLVGTGSFVQLAGKKNRPQLRSKKAPMQTELQGTRKNQLRLLSMTANSGQPFLRLFGPGP